MSTGGREPPPYIIPVGGSGADDGVKVYNLHTPFTPPSSTITRFATQQNEPYVSATNENANSAQAAAPVSHGAPAEQGINRFVSEEHHLGRTPSMTTCPSCQQQVLTDVTYKVGSYAWIMCFVFILCGLVLCCCLIPFFLKHFKDVHHSCPRCHRLLHVEKKKCCS